MTAGAYWTSVESAPNSLTIACTNCEWQSDDSVVWSDEDDAAVIFEALPGWHPSVFVDVFRIGLQSDEDHALELLRQGFVTPESVDAWGDFAAARTIANSGLKISTTPLWGKGAPDVAYVRIVDTDAWIASSVDQPAAMHVTLVWRPELAVTPGSSWRVHQLGESVPPELVPRTAAGFDPRSCHRSRPLSDRSAPRRLTRAR